MLTIVLSILVIIHLDQLKPIESMIIILDLKNLESLNQ